MGVRHQTSILNGDLPCGIYIHRHIGHRLAQTPGGWPEIPGHSAASVRPQQKRKEDGLPESQSKRLKLATEEQQSGETISEHWQGEDTSAIGNAVRRYGVYLNRLGTLCQVPFGRQRVEIDADHWCLTCTHAFRSITALIKNFIIA